MSLTESILLVGVSMFERVGRDVVLLVVLRVKVCVCVCVCEKVIWQG